MRFTSSRRCSLRRSTNRSFRVVQQTQPLDSSKGSSVVDNSPLRMMLTQRRTTCPSYSCPTTNVPGVSIRVPATVSLSPCPATTTTGVRIDRLHIGNDFHLAVGYATVPLHACRQRLSLSTELR